MYICEQEILADFNLAVAKVEHQTAKFNSPPNFLAIRYATLQALHLSSVRKRAMESHHRR